MTEQARQKLQHELAQFLVLAHDVTDPVATGLVSEVIEHLKARLKEEVSGPEAS